MMVMKQKGESWKIEDGIGQWMDVAERDGSRGRAQTTVHPKHRVAGLKGQINSQNTQTA